MRPQLAKAKLDESRPICRSTDIKDIAKQLIIKKIIFMTFTVLKAKSLTIYNSCGFGVYNSLLEIDN